MNEYKFLFNNGLITYTSFPNGKSVNWYLCQNYKKIKSFGRKITAIDYRCNPDAYKGREIDKDGYLMEAIEWEYM